MNPNLDLNRGNCYFHKGPPLEQPAVKLKIDTPLNKILFRYKLRRKKQSILKILVFGPTKHLN